MGGWATPAAQADTQTGQSRSLASPGSSISPISLGAAAPARLLGLSAALAAMVAAGTMVAAMHVPSVSIAITRAGADTVHIAGPDVDVPATAPLVFTAPGQAPQTFQAVALADDADPRIGHDGNIAHWDRLSELATTLAGGTAVLRYPGADGTTHDWHIASREQTLATLCPHFWLPWLTTVIALVVGLWVWTVRHRDWASRQFALMSIGIAAAALPIAIAGETPLATPDYRWLLVTNSLGSLLFGAGLLGMLARFPLPLLPRRFADVTLAACLALIALQLFELVPAPYPLIGGACLAILVAMLVLLAAQVVAARHDAPARAAATILATTVSASVVVVVAVAVLPIVIGARQPLHTAFAIPLLLVIHLGVAAATVRSRSVAVERWAGGATREALVTALVIGFDIALVAVAWAVMGPAGAVMTILLTTAHIGLRNGLRRRRDAGARERERVLLRQITQLALAADADRRQALWIDALQLAFAPLDIAPGAAGDTRLSIADDGRLLHVPATAETDALVLSHAENGYRRFDQGHLARARELCTLMASVTSARDAYLRGVVEERRRIARDLHDDVGARLMTSLHRHDSGMMRQDVRDAMADIRLIVGNLVGERRRLEEVLADIRHEAATRLTDADIALDWPPCAGPPDATTVSGEAARHLTSMLRELVSNTIRHAHAGKVAVRVSRADDDLHLTFADDGVGRGAQGNGYGLANVMRRAAALGGTATLADPPGFTAHLHLPRITAIDAAVDAVRTAAAQ
ncbi:sensor histidine kinase [Sphingomonas sp. RS2018]